MKCESCGAALSLEMVYCPYCGKENKAAKQHVSDMAYYKGEFEETKKNVYEKTRAYTHNAVKIAIVAILAIVWVGVLFLAANAYELRDAIADARNLGNFKEMEAQIWDYLEDEEYYALATYCSENEINPYDSKFEEYAPVLILSSQYKYFYECLLRVMTPSRYDLEYLDDDIGYLANSIESFYDSYNRDWEASNYDNRYDMSVMQPEIDKMERVLQVLLRAYVGLTEQEASQLADMTTGQRITLLEEGLLSEEE